MKEKYPGYRKLKVENATKRNNGNIEIDFRNCRVSFSIPLKNAKRYGLEILTAGDVIYVKGKKGNEDVDLWGGNLIEDIIYPKS